MKLNSELLQSTSIENAYNSIFNAHGIYSTEKFVLRLSSKNHGLIDQLTDKVVDFKNVDGDTIQAYSTYLHETIHWWQHIGSTTGFVLSMCYPLQTITNILDLKKLVAQGDSKKSIKSSSIQGQLAGKTPTDINQGIKNKIINNTMDIEFFKKWILKSENINEIYNDSHFESQGHSFNIVYCNLMDYITKLIDPNSTFLNDVDNWDKEFKNLTDNNAVGYCHNSPIARKCVGVFDIFEGQACFSQMYFLANINHSISDLDNFKSCGMLHGVYEKAFDEFLRISNIEYPKSVLDPVVGLFLLICDLSINPMEGFPCKIKNFSRFYLTNDPGIRFELLCLSVKKLGTSVRHKIKEHSKSEYMEVSSLLLNLCHLDHPSEGWEEISSWIDKTDEINSLMEEYNNINYSNQDTVLRVMLSSFISFTLDKKENPEFFCWPGHWKSNGKKNDVILPLWLKHLSLFTDQEYDDGIFIRNFPNKDPEALSNTLNCFFANNLLYDLTKQWILIDGEFSYNFKWLSEKRDEQYWREWSDGLFEQQYGIPISKIGI